MDKATVAHMPAWRASGFEADSNRWLMSSRIGG
jgi:hypothetical protein